MRQPSLWDFENHTFQVRIVCITKNDIYEFQHHELLSTIRVHQFFFQLSHFIPSHFLELFTKGAQHRVIRTAVEKTPRSRGAGYRVPWCCGVSKIIVAAHPQKERYACWLLTLKPFPRLEFSTCEAVGLSDSSLWSLFKVFSFQLVWNLTVRYLSCEMDIEHHRTVILKWPIRF